MDGNDTELVFKQEGDVVSIENKDNVSIDKICFYYSGHSATFYANKNACFLPGFFAYYPKPGICKLYKDSLYVASEEKEANYSVYIADSENITSNLPMINGRFEGKAENVILVKGKYLEKDINGTTCVTLPLDSESEYMLVDLLTGEMHDGIENMYKFLNIENKNNIERKKIFVIPGSVAFNSALKPYYEFSDYVLFNGYAMGTYDILKNQKVSKEKCYKRYFVKWE